MSALTISYIPGYTLSVGEVITIDKLNALARPTINLAGSVGTTLVNDASITTVKLVDGVLSANTTGRAKMADGYFSADATGRGKFTAGFFGASDATSLALFADGFWPATTGGRAKFAAGFVDSTLINAAVVPVIGSSRNLLAFNNTSTPTSKVDVTADEVVLKESSGKPFLATSVSVTANLAASGANGLDTGSEAGSVWYYVWLIYNGTTVASLFSTSATAPTMPSGYTFKALVSVVYNNGSSNFVTLYQQDRRLWVNDALLFTARAAVGTNTYESYSTPGTVDANDLDLKTVVPPIAKRLRGTIGSSSSSNVMIAIAADANGLGAVTAANAASNGGFNSFFQTMTFEIPLKTAQTFFWKADSTTARARINVNGYDI